MKKYIILILMSQLMSENLNCQPNQNNVHVICNSSVDSITFMFLNKSNDTLYLFSSYFDNYCPSSKYLHRVDLSKHVYRISFVPLIPFISYSLSDKIVLNDRRVISLGQVTYKFIQLLPKKSTTLNLEKNIVFKNYNNKNNLVEDFNLKDLSFNQLNKLHFYNLKAIKKSCKLKFEFAIYKDISFVNKIKIYGENTIDAYKYLVVSCPFENRVIGND